MRRDRAMTYAGLKGLCRFYVEGRTCPYGRACKYRHSGTAARAYQLDQHEQDHRYPNSENDWTDIDCTGSTDMEDSTDEDLNRDRHRRTKRSKSRRKKAKKRNKRRARQADARQYTLHTAKQDEDPHDYVMARDSRGCRQHRQHFC